MWSLDLSHCTATSTGLTHEEICYKYTTHHILSYIEQSCEPGIYEMSSTEWLKGVVAGADRATCVPFSKPV